MTLIALLGWFVLLAVIEVAAARGKNREPTSDGRLVTNFGLTAAIFLVGSLLPLTNLAASVIGRSFGTGLAGLIALPWMAILILTLITQTFALYWAHRLMHRLPLFWRVHRVHHADDSVDVSTSFRNHPLELAVTLPVSAAAVLAVGSPPSVVIAAQTVLSAVTIWQHADITLPSRIDRALGWVIVTPRLHRLHHNPERATHDTNYGELLTLWDRLFGTFNGSRGRRSVGLEDQVARPDRLLQQIWSPVYSV